MPELPEIASRAREMQAALVGKNIAAIDVLQPKCVNVPVETFQEALTGAEIRDISFRGKWIQVETTQGWLLINLGMGGELLLVTADRLPEKRRVVFHFTDGSALSANFWWFGSTHYAVLNGLGDHEPTAKLGPNALDVTAASLRARLNGRRVRVKSFLLDQTQIAGIGNAYVHDILFLAQLHPLRTVDTLGDHEIEALARAIHIGLQPAVDKGGAFYELNLHGQNGGFTMDDIRIGYREGQPCPVCASAIEKIRTGSTSSFLCPQCQAEI